MMTLPPAGGRRLQDALALRRGAQQGHLAALLLGRERLWGEESTLLK